ncbi:hypothetical protein HYPBUDRAFT_151639 [Hyphopichia burtonii NRRL Y-1933]|uniref:Uncharacterized protein n=1 Tax=Hyphopichia burtonii NRRL Y-1933 TaxID=984485 RepID=A0A1E4RSH3_9ASCO|nr:hypothetical protein HYPBUDRAFT_151639 [Hyphopichia burtonii NRRL Y-1933]ODV70230.1 hypothetical protein HYPBUDRAFT_151639 [Hyphopichia burtonii NRRL Y-1933]
MNIYYEQKKLVARKLNAGNPSYESRMTKSYCHILCSRVRFFDYKEPHTNEAFCQYAK